MVHLYNKEDATLGAQDLERTENEDAENLDPQEETKVNENTTPAQAELLAALDAG